MNILWLPNFCPFPVDCGGKVSISNRMIYVAKKHNIYMITQSDKIGMETISILDSLCKDYYILKPSKRSKIQYFKWFVSGPINVGKYKNEAVTSKILEFLEKYKIDLINIDLPMVAASLVPIWDRINDIKIVINQHNIEFDCVKSKIRTTGISPMMKLYALIESKRLYKWENKLYRRKNVVAHIFVTREDMLLFEKSFNIPRSVKLLYSPMATEKHECERGDVALLTNKKNIVFSAAFNYPPNIHGALWFVEKVFPQILKSYGNVRLILVGREPSDAIRRLNSDSILVTGTVPSVSPYFDIADLFIVPIFYGGGVKTKLIEAGVYGKPLVATRNGAHGTLYCNEEDILITDDESKFAEYCIDILKHSDRYISMGENFLKKTQKYYMWSSVGPKYCEYLESVIKE